MVKPVDDKTSWGLGIGMGLQKKPYTGYDTKLRVLPNIFVDNRWIRVAGQNIDGKLGSMGDVSFTLRAKLGLADGYKSSDADILDGMEKRKGGVWIGPSATWRSDIVNVTGEVLTDASQYSKGQQATLSVSKSFRFGKLGVMPSVGATWLSAKYVDYYYGVETGEARIGRLAYEGKSTVNVTTSVRLSYDFSAHHAASLDAGVRYFGSSIADSPLLENRTQPLLNMGYLYRF